jgi:hypothetical protein
MMLRVSVAIAIHLFLTWKLGRWDEQAPEEMVPRAWPEAPMSCGGT